MALRHAHAQSARFPWEAPDTGIIALGKRRSRRRINPCPTSNLALCCPFLIRWMVDCTTFRPSLLRSS